MEVIAGRATAAMVASGDEAAISLTAARAAGGYPADFALSSLPRSTGSSAMASSWISGTTQVTPIATPGHSHDHISYCA